MNFALHSGFYCSDQFMGILHIYTLFPAPRILVEFTHNSLRLHA